MLAYELIVRGIVQGVGFRYFTKQKADSLSIGGHVHNNTDGSVQIYVVGQKAPVIDFLDWCHHGPDTATVESLEYHEVAIKRVDQFQIIR